MARRLTIAASIVFGGLVLLIIGAVVFREPLLESALERLLAARGVPEPRLRVTALTLDEIRLSELALGRNAELRAEEVVVHYDPREAIEGRLGAVELIAPTLRLDLTDRAAPLGSLQPLLAPGAGEDRAGPPLPRLQITDGEITAASPIGELHATLDGEVKAEGSGYGVYLAFEAESPQGEAAGTLAVDLGAEISGMLTLTGGGAHLPDLMVEGLRGRIAFALADGWPQRIDGRLTLATLDAAGAGFEDASFAIEADGSRATTRVSLRSRDRGLSLAVDGTLEDYRETPRLALDLDATLDAAAGIWRRLPLPAPDTGRAQLRVQASGTLPPLARLAEADLSSLEGELESASQGLTGRLEATLDEVAYADRFAGLDGEISLAGAWRDRVLTVRPIGENRVALSGIEPAWLESLGISADLIAVSSPGLSLALAADAGPAPSLRLERRETGYEVGGRLPLRAESASGAQLALDASGSAAVDRAFALRDWNLDRVAVDLADLALPQARARRLRLDGHLSGGAEHLAGQVELSLALDRIAYGPVQGGAAALDALPIRLWSEPGETSLQLARPGRVRLLELTLAERLRLTGPAEIALREAEIRFGRNSGPEVVPTASLVGSAEAIEIALLGATEEPLPAALGVGRVSLELRDGALSAEIADLRLDLPSLALALEGVAVNARQQLGSDRAAAEVTAATLRQTGPRALAAPVTLTGSLRRDGGRVDLEAEARAAKGEARVALSAEHDLDTGAGRGEARLEPLAFAPEGLQPATLAPPLAVLDSVTGRLEAAAQAAWGPDGLTDSGGRVQLSDLSFRAQGTSVQGLVLDLTLARLWPPASPPGQSLEIALIDPGVPLRDLSARFGILPGPPPQLAVANFGTGVSGGRIAFRDLTIDPAAEGHELPLSIERVDLAELFDLLAIEGLSGTGQVSGTLPIRLRGNAVAVENGRLEAEGPGILRLRSAQAAQIFAGAGPEGQLLIDALKDFHYDSLVLTLDKPLDADAELALHLAGNNPAVREGQPFNINVTLTGHTGRLLAAFRQIYALSDDILRRAWMFGRSAP